VASSFQSAGVISRVEGEVAGWNDVLVAREYFAAAREATQCIEWLVVLHLNSSHLKKRWHTETSGKTFHNVGIFLAGAIPDQQLRLASLSTSIVSNFHQILTSILTCYTITTS
jgi:hypothetical protein